MRILNCMWALRLFCSVLLYILSFCLSVSVLLWRINVFISHNLWCSTAICCSWWVGCCCCTIIELSISTGSAGVDLSLSMRLRGWSSRLAVTERGGTEWSASRVAAENSAYFIPVPTPAALFLDQTLRTEVTRNLTAAAWFTVKCFSTLKYHKIYTANTYGTLCPLRTQKLVLHNNQRESGSAAAYLHTASVSS